MKKFTNISVEKMATLLGLKIVGRGNKIVKDDIRDTPHYMCCAMQIYLLLHFWADANTGITKVIDIVKLAARLGKKIKTVVNAIDDLVKGGLITILEQPERNYVVIRIDNIQDMYKRRGEGGHGYLVFTLDLVNIIIDIDNVDILRAVLMALIKSTSNATTYINRTTTIQLSTSDVKLCYPASTRLADIHRACDNDGPFGYLFERVQPDEKKLISIKLRPQYDGKYVKQQIKLDAKNKIGLEIRALNSIIRDANKGIADKGYMPARSTYDFGIHNIDILDYISSDRDYALPELNCFTENVIADCATIAQDYDVDIVINAIHIFYAECLISKGLIPQTQMLGGMIRNIVNELCDCN
jgi:hypothetical protein